MINIFLADQTTFPPTSTQIQTHNSENRPVPAPFEHSSDNMKGCQTEQISG